jgi:hypothetical protein
VPSGPRTCLVVGSYPPVPGPAAAATVAAVRRAWASGHEVVVVSPRPSAAQLVMAAAGADVGRALSRLRPVVAAGPGSCHGGRQVVLCLEPGWPLGRGRQEHGGERGGPLKGSVNGTFNRLAARLANRPLSRPLSRPPKRQLSRPPNRPLSREDLERTARSLAAALSEFDRAELVVTGDLGVPPDILGLLWPAVERVTANSEELAAVLRAAGAPEVGVAEPFAGARLPAPSAGDDARKGGADASLVSPLEPADRLLVARGRRLIGSAARKVLGPRAPAVRAYLLRTWIRARKSLMRLAGGAGPSKSHP